MTLFKALHPAVLVLMATDYDNNERIFDAIARKVVQQFQIGPPSRIKEHNLTPRGTQILELQVKGSLYKKIAWVLGIGFEIVRTRTEAVVKYLASQ